MIDKLTDPSLFPILHGVVGDLPWDANAQVWVVMPSGDGLACESLIDIEQLGLGTKTRVCRAVHPDGTLVIGDADPGQDAELLELLQRDHCGRV
ncbi:MAG: hypothetical protein GY716_14340 [bacterium]|nr:hypothetical protein [bacterium]